MFEEICLVCGKQLNDDGRAYCSDDCQHIDLSSPSISSSSSVLSSPNMGYAVGGEVPALLPSVLGSALKKYASHSGRYVSSSSASSTSWSFVTDEEDKENAHRYDVNDFSNHDPSDPLYSEDSKSPNYVYSVNSAALSYARRPSGTNNPSTVPHSHRRLSSGFSSWHVRGIPRSAPLLSHPHADEDEGYSDPGCSSGDALDMDDVYNHSEKDWGVGLAAKPKYIPPSKVHRARNRVSLPACFSLLKNSSPRKDFKSSPVSSNNTIARASPPTPKIPGPSQVPIAPAALLTSVHTTPRGRRRESDKSRSSRSGYSSPSWSQSRSRRPPAGCSPSKANERKGDADVDYWAITSIPLRRGREATRRNSSPPVKTLMGVDPNLAFASGRGTQEGDRTRTTSDSRPRTRGRARVEDLGGLGLSSDAPGYGYGRSGLVDRERGTGSYLARVPL